MFFYSSCNSNSVSGSEVRRGIGLAHLIGELGWTINTI